MTIRHLSSLGKNRPTGEQTTLNFQMEVTLWNAHEGRLIGYLHCVYLLALLCNNKVSHCLNQVEKIGIKIV